MNINIFSDGFLKQKKTYKVMLYLAIGTGLVRIFSDFTQGADSINGQFLSSIGASATVIGFVAGFRKLLDYAIRPFIGYICDKTNKYYEIAIFGLSINMASIPLIYFAPNKLTVIVLMLLSSAGRGIESHQ